MTGKESEELKNIALEYLNLSPEYKVLVHIGIIKDKKYNENENRIIDILTESNDVTNRYIGGLLYKYKLLYEEEKKSSIHLFNTVYNIYKILSDLGVNPNKKNVIENLLYVINAVENELKKLNKDITKAKKELHIKKPKGKKIEDLVKFYIDTALKNNEIPTLRQLDSDIYSFQSYSRKLKDFNFIALIYKEIEKRLNNKKLSNNKRKLLIQLENDIRRRLQMNQKFENKKTGQISKNQPNFNDNIMKEINNEFEELRQY
jgi:hypothetical protein